MSYIDGFIVAVPEQNRPPEATCSVLAKSLEPTGATARRNGAAA